MRRVEWHALASEDIFSIIEYIAADNPDAADVLADEIDSKVGLLPERWRIYRRGRVAGTREMVVRQNYIVVFAVAGPTVIVLRVLHASRQWPPQQKRPSRF